MSGRVIRRGPDHRAALPLLPAGYPGGNPRSAHYLQGNGSRSDTGSRQQAAGPDRLRGQIIIDFFGLNAREQLHRDRARMITVYSPALLAQQQGQASASGLDLIARVDSPNLPHADCLRAFKGLWASDATMASQVFEQCGYIC